MKKALAITLALCTALSMTACGSAPSGGSTMPSQTETRIVETQATTIPETVAVETLPVLPMGAHPADSIPDVMTSADGSYELAFVTSSGQLKDLSYNEGTYDGIKLYAVEKNLSYRHYQPVDSEQSTDEDVYEAVKAAAENGARIIVVAGTAQNTLLSKAASEYPDIRFICIDSDIAAAGDNLAQIVFKEEQSGYLAGYAAVKEGYRKLGFLGGGGGVNPACCRYGYGYAQGANDAAKELGVSIEMKYSWLYGSAYAATMELRTLAASWYREGTEVIFACGGSMFNSVCSASITEGGLVIGVDVDQSFQSPTVITSALKDVTSAAQWAISKSYNGTWEEIGGKTTALGAAEESTGLPTDTWTLKNYSKEDYSRLHKAIADGSIDIDNTVLENDEIAARSFDHLTIEYVSEDPFAAGSGTRLGGWNLNEGDLDISANPEAREAFDQATMGLMGVGYEPLAVVAGKLVAGNNCCILARARAVAPDAAPYFALVFVHKGLMGDATLLDVMPLENTGTSGTLAGGWTANDGSIFLKDQPEVHTAFQAAVAGSSDATYSPIAYLSSQLVAGRNYTLLARADAADGASLVQLQIYVDLNGNASLTRVNPIDLTPQA